MLILGQSEQLEYSEIFMHYFKKLIPQQLKNIYHLGQAIFANIVFGFPSRKLKVIGVTGTDGKTTTTQMIFKVLETKGEKVALASTINFKIGEIETANLSHYTTMSPFSLQKFIKEAAEKGCKYLVLETSSHSLDQHRVWGIKYQTAVITNVTREHLDYHKTIDKYRKAKLKLFKNAKNAIVNLDMEDSKEFLQFSNEKKITYSVKSEQADVFAQNIETGINGSIFKIQNSNFKINLPGLFNIENALAATCVGIVENIDLDKISKALGEIKNVPGRMEFVPNEKELNILIDFALTPNALEKLYSLIFTLKKPNAKIIAVFGSCGERDRGKRPVMGEVVSKYADYMVITNDEPYREDPNQIMEEIIRGIKGKEEGISFWKIEDRREAIKKAIELANPKDIIAITGMGSLETMIVGSNKIPWNDKKTVQEILN